MEYLLYGLESNETRDYMETLLYTTKDSNMLEKAKAYAIKQELRYNLIEYVKQCDEDRTDFDDLHHEVFNEDYYIIGYYQASQWLKQHDVDAFEAIRYVIEQELAHFGESNLKHQDINSEHIVNLLVYFAAFDIMPDCDLSNTSKTEILELLESD